MKKYFNARLPLLFAIVLVLGVAAGYAIFYYNVNAVWLTAICCVLAVGLIALLIYKGNKRRLIIISIVIAIMFFGALNCFFRLNIFESSPIVDGGKYEVEGTIIAREEAAEGAYVTVGFAKANGNSLGGNVKAFIHESCLEGCEVGKVINFYTSVEKQDAFKFGNFNVEAAENIKYFCRVYYGIELSQGFYPFGTINAAIRNILFNNLDYTTASIACGMLTGNTSAMDEGTLQNFRYGGIAHIFAVSGLHIGIIYGALSFICKAFKSNKYVSALICVVGVFIYSGICGFTASSLRSAVMCLVACVAKLIHGKYDGLNSLSVAAIILLVINPLWLFTLGFQLSFMAVASIFLFSHAFKNLFKKLPNKVASSLGISISVQAGSLPVMLNSFGYLSIAGIFLNVILIPVLSFIFVLILFCVALSAIIPPLAQVLINFASAPLELIMSSLSSLGVENAIIRSSGLSFIFPFWYIILFSISQIVNIKMPTRAIISTVSATICGVMCILSALSPILGTNIHVTANHNGEGVVITKAGKSVIIITELSKKRFIENTINKYCFIPPSAIIVIGEENTSFYSTFQIDNLCQNIYLPPESINPDDLSGKEINYQRKFSIFGVNYEYLNGRDLLIFTEGITVGVSCGESCQISSCDLFVSTKINNTVSRTKTVYFSIQDYKYNIYNYGDLHFYAKNDKIKRQGLIPNKESLY